MRYTKYANTQPREWKSMPWAYEANSLPILRKSLGTIAIGSIFLFVCTKLMGVA